MYWVDLYRLSRIFLSYFRAVRCYKQQKWYSAFRLFENLLRDEFAPSLPYLAIMRFKGLGSKINVEAAKYYCERAIRNDYYECLYLLAVFDFFGNNLNDYYRKLYQTEADAQPLYFKVKNKANGEKSDFSTNKVHLKNSNRETLTPDYKECVFHLKEYFKYLDEKDSYYGEACALLAYCLGKGEGTEPDEKASAEYFAKAKSLGSKNAQYLQECLAQQKDVAEYQI